MRIGPDGGVWRAGTVRGQIVLRRRLEPQEAAAGGVAVEMLTRACDTRDKWKVADVQRGLRRYVEWQERVEADAIVSPDGCRKTLSEGDRSWQAAGFAMTKHVFLLFSFIVAFKEAKSSMLGDVSFSSTGAT